MLLTALLVLSLLSACGKSGARPTSRYGSNNYPYANQNVNQGTNNNSANQAVSYCPSGKRFSNLTGVMTDSSGAIRTDAATVSIAGNGIKRTYQNNQTGNQVVVEGTAGRGIIVRASLCVPTSSDLCALTRINFKDTSSPTSFTGTIIVACLDEQDYPITLQ